MHVSRSKAADTGEEHETDVVRPVAELGLKLKGTIAGSRDIARAILEDQKEQKSYRIGDEIKGAKLLAIYRNKVIMDVGGQEQMLVIEDVKTKPASPAPSPGAPRAGRPPAGAPLPGVDSGMPNLMETWINISGRPGSFRTSREGSPTGSESAT